MNEEDLLKMMKDSIKKKLCGDLVSCDDLTNEQIDKKSLEIVPFLENAIKQIFGGQLVYALIISDGNFTRTMGNTSLLTELIYDGLRQCIVNDYLELQENQKSLRKEPKSIRKEHKEIH